MLPDFIIIGAQKAGTASLYNYLVQHPQIRRAGRKEVHFFDRAWDRGETWYRAFFPTAIQQEWAMGGLPALTGEASPYYLFHPAVPARVRYLLPDARLIVLLRDPVSRAYSQYNFFRAKGAETRSFEAAIAEELELGYESGITQELVESKRVGRRFPFPFYIARGVYFEQLKRWLGQFPRHQLAIHSAERFYRDTHAVVKEVQEHLGVQPRAVDVSKIANQNRYIPIAENTRRHLAELYAPHNERLFELIGHRYEWSACQ